MGFFGQLPDDELPPTEKDGPLFNFGGGGLFDFGIAFGIGVLLLVAFGGGGVTGGDLKGIC